MNMFRVGDIKPNPFRDLTRYPTSQAKVDKLRASIASTGFWDNVVARLRDGVPEIAYGHYRLEAVRQELGEDATVGLIIRDLSDDDMIRIMAEENMEEGRNSAEAAHEVIRAVVTAYAAGLVALPAPPSNASHLRRAPLFSRDTDISTDHLYSDSTVAAFLGGSWTETRVKNALTQLAATESGEVPEEVFQGFGPRIAVDIVSAARAAKGQAERAGMDKDTALRIGREVAVEVADSLREGGEASVHGSATKLAVGDVRNRAINARVPTAVAAKPAPPAYRVAEHLRDYIQDVFARTYNGSTGTYGELLEALIANLGSLSLTQPLGPNGPNLETEIAGALRDLATQATQYADRVGGKGLA